MLRQELYTYNEQGLRIKKEEFLGSNVKKTYYVYSGNDILFTETYINDTPIDMVFNLADMASFTHHYGTDAKEELNYYYKDHRQNRIVKTESNGDIVSSANKFSYSSWGELDNPEATEESWFTGKKQDSTGLYYFNARYYDSDMGKFISQDPAKDGMNWYTYCNNNPVNMVDPNGKEAVTITVFAAVKLIEAAVIATYGLYELAKAIRESKKLKEAVNLKSEEKENFKLGQCLVSDTSYRDEKSGLFIPPHAGFDSGFETYGEYLDSMGEVDLERLAKIPVPIIIIRDINNKVIAAKLTDGTHRALLLMDEFGRNVDLYDPSIRRYWKEVQPHDINEFEKNPANQLKIDENVRKAILEGIDNDIGPDLFTAYDEWKSGDTRSQHGEWFHADF